MEPEKKKVTVFDFDGTLTEEDTFISFSRYALGEGPLVWGIIKSLPFLIKWKFGFISNSCAKETLYSFLYKGKRKEEIMALSRNFKPTIKKEIEQQLFAHKAQGDAVYILSASLDLWMREVAERWGVGLICTRTLSDDSGHLTGKFEGGNCYGEEKYRKLLEEVGDRESFFLTVYGDEPEKGDAVLFREADDAVKV